MVYLAGKASTYYTPKHFHCCKIDKEQHPIGNHYFWDYIEEIPPLEYLTIDDQMYLGKNGLELGKYFHGMGLYQLTFYLL